MKFFIFYESDSAEKSSALSEEHSIESARVLGVGAKANLEDKSGKPALKNTKSRNWAKVKRGQFVPDAGMSARNKEQRTNLPLAAKYGDLESVERLLAEGVDVDETSKNGMTALHLAALNGHKSVLDADADANSDGLTALMRAAQAGFQKVQVLLAGTDTPSRTKKAKKRRSRKSTKE